jgi:hypothetical protein
MTELAGALVPYGKGRVCPRPEPPASDEIQAALARRVGAGSTMAA